MMQIGKKIKELRKQRKMKLVELADKTGIQIATLSRMEHNKMTGTLASHMKIAKALSIDLVDLYQELAAPSMNPETVTNRMNAETFAMNERASYEILTGTLSDKKMMPIMMRVEPNGKTIQEHGKPGCERFIFILKGKLSIHIGEKIFELKQNNSLYFDASVNHHFENHASTTAKFLSVMTPVTL